MTLCYDGDAFRRVLAQPGAKAEEQARAALALTRPDCIDPALPVRERMAPNAWRAQTLDRIDATAALTRPAAQRLHARRAAVWASVAFDRSRQGEPAQAAAQRTIDQLAAVDRQQLSDDDRAAYDEAAVRVGASRWAAQPSVAPAAR